MDPLERLTVVIPSFNRQLALEGAIRYWSGRSPRVLVLDGTTEPLAPSLLSTAGANIQYVHAPADLLERMSLIPRYVSTDFVALMADDEIHLPSALRQCVEFLQLDSRYVSCIGWALGFESDSEVGLRGSPVYDTLRGYCVDDADSKKRISAHLVPYRVPACIYAVCRSDAFTVALNTVVGGPTNLFFSQGELEFEMMMAAQGSIGTISKLHWLRNLSPSEFRGTEVQQDPERSLRRFWNESTHAEQRGIFLEHMSKRLSPYVGVGNSDWLARIVHEHLTHEETSAFVACLRSQRARVSRIASTHVPEVHSWLRRWRYNYRMRTGGSILALANEYRQGGCEVDESELQEALANLRERASRGT